MGLRCRVGAETLLKFPLRDLLSQGLETEILGVFPLDVWQMGRRCQVGAETSWKYPLRDLLSQGVETWNLFAVLLDVLFHVCLVYKKCITLRFIIHN
jgi:hypothetical protein